MGGPLLVERPQYGVVLVTLAEWEALAQPVTMATQDLQKGPTGRRGAAVPAVPGSLGARAHRFSRLSAPCEVCRHR